MKTLKITLIALLFIKISFALDIQEYSIVFDIQEDMSVVEKIKIAFSQPLEEKNLTYVVKNGKISEINISNRVEELKFRVEENKIIIHIPNGTRELHISFKLLNAVTRYNEGKEFLVYVHFPEAKFVKFYVWLPKGYVIFKDGVIPRGEISSDGERIFVSWENKESPLIVRFYKASESRIELLLAFVFALIAIFLIVISLKSEDYLIGFSSDEVKVILSLKEKKVVYQNKLERELGFSRAKMTRIIKKLESKGLIEKEKIGRTNKIKWK
ncbi:MAG: MarR family transcriptional regulator [Candidatus Aenigmarchaeota archaeon]|nr:MarR family transcriptional regulator [Candidatus Aenigmarchaeota archaeon]